MSDGLRIQGISDSRGNVVDLAVGVVIGAAFGKIVTSFVEDLLMPPIGLLMGGVDFTALKIVLKGTAIPRTRSAEVAIRYGVFINTLIQFVIVAAAIFLVVKAINSSAPSKGRWRTAPPAAPTASEALLADIRDLLARSAPRV